MIIFDPNFFSASYFFHLFCCRQFRLHARNQIFAFSRPGSAHCTLKDFSGLLELVHPRLSFQFFFFGYPRPCPSSCCPHLKYRFSSLSCSSSLEISLWSEILISPHILDVRTNFWNPPSHISAKNHSAVLLLMRFDISVLTCCFCFGLNLIDFLLVRTIYRPKTTLNMTKRDPILNVFIINLHIHICISLFVMYVYSFYDFFAYISIRYWSAYLKNQYL